MTININKQFSNSEALFCIFEQMLRLKLRLYRTSPYPWSPFLRMTEMEFLDYLVARQRLQLGLRFGLLGVRIS
jgi:hypothetical protein